MLNFVYGVLATWFVLGLGYSFWWGDNNLYTLLMKLPGGIIGIIVEVVSFPIIWFYMVFLRHTIKSVTPAQVEKADIMKDSKHLFGPVYICFDKKAKRLCNKVFLFRVQWFEQDNIPSSPEGNFRIGVDN